MKKVLKWIGVVLSALVGVGLLVVGGMYLSSDLRFNKTYTIQPEPVAVSNDEASLARGKHWVEIHCQTCHGDDLSGGPFFEDPALGYVDAPNLTAGKGGVGAVYTDADWVRAIRHGVKVNGKSVFIMPSNDFYYVNDADLGGIIAYVKSFPPVDREIRTPRLSFMAKVLYAAGAFGNLLYAEVIPHDVRPPAPPEGLTVEYGNYLASAHGCKSCHGEDLAGGQPSEPGAPPAPNLTQAGELKVWSESDFITALSTGVVPSGRQLNEYMPVEIYKKLTTDEMKAIWMYLQTLNSME